MLQIPRVSPCAGIGNRLRVFDAITAAELLDHAALPPNARVHGLRALSVDGGANAVLAIHGDCYAQARAATTTFERLSQGASSQLKQPGTRVHRNMSRCQSLRVHYGQLCSLWLSRLKGQRQ